MRKSGLPDIREWWQAAMLQAEPVTAEHTRARQTPEAATSKKAMAAAWRRIRGPIGAASLSLARIGWRFSSPFAVVDDRGTEVILTHTTPQLLKDLLVEGVRRNLERQMGRRWADKCQAYAGRRVCTDLAVAAIRQRAKTSPFGAGAYRAAVCGAPPRGPVGPVLVHGRLPTPS